MNYTVLQLLRRILVLAKPYGFHLVATFILSLLASPIALLKPVALKVLIDSGFGSEPLPKFISFFTPAGAGFDFASVLFITAILVIIVALIENLHIVATWILNIFVGEKLVLSLRSRLFNHIQRLSLAYHDTMGTSDAFYRLQWDTVAIRVFLIGNISPLISSILTVAGMLIVMFLIDWHFALIAACFIPPMIILIRFSTFRLKRDWAKVKQDESMAMKVVQEALGSLRVVKAFGREDSEEEKYVNQAEKAVSGQVRVAWVSAMYYFVVGLLFAIGTAVFIFIGAKYVRAGTMTLGELTLVIAYLAQIVSPLEKISKNFNDLQSSVTSLSRVFTLLDKEKEVEESPNARHLEKAKGSFEFQHVSFSYSKDMTAMNDISFKINEGDRVGIMGKTGAGKSTLISLLIRFYDPVSGTILIDDENIRNYKLADYRSQFSIVLQEPVLFSTTIEENIRYGKPGATDKEVVDAAKAANAHEFILNSKDGYKTMVGERGMQISGGERQRISLARAFIKNAPVLILDEPTSSVDVRTESLIMEAMERLMHGKTSFLITHRLDTLKTCNVILHLDKGALVDVMTNVNSEVLEEIKRNYIES